MPPAAIRSVPRRSAPLFPRWGVIALAILVQVVASLAIGESSILGVAHAGGLLLVGMYAVLNRDLPLAICSMAYVTGSEVLWRQASVPIPYLAAPYMLTLLSAFAVIVVLRRLGKDGRLALLYVALMLPASINTVRTMGPGAREAIAFALSGPVALAAFVAFTSQIRVAPWLYRRILWTTLVSAVGPLTLAVSRLRADYLASGGIEFNAQSNFAASGGFGPVQVSSMLSLGIISAVLLLISEPNRVARWVAGVAGIAFMIQTLLTFSRGGSFSAVIAVAVLALARATDARARRRIAVIVAAVITLSFTVVFPWLEEFTGGAFEQRFSNASTTRTELAANDTQIFLDNIVLGVGPGMTKYQRLGYDVCELRSDDCRDEASSHTEFTRMLGEHGLPGIAALVALAILAWRAFRHAGAGSALALTFLAWAIAQMVYANLRITAVPFAFGLALLKLADDRGEPIAHAARGPRGRRRPGAPPAVVRSDRPVGFGAGYTPSVRREARPGFGANYGPRGIDGLGEAASPSTTTAPSDPSTNSSTNGTMRLNGRSRADGRDDHPR